MLTSFKLEGGESPLTLAGDRVFFAGEDDGVDEGVRAFDGVAFVEAAGGVDTGDGGTLFCCNYK